MKKLLASGMVVIGLLAIASIFAMMHQQDNIQLEAAPPITEIALLFCGTPGFLIVTPGITTVLDGSENCAEALQMLIENEGLRIHESSSAPQFSWVLITDK